MRDVNSVVFGQAGPARQADAGLWGATGIKFDPGPPLTLTRPSGALGQAGDGGDQDRAEHKAHDADRGKDKTLPSGQAFAFGIIEERGEFLVDLDYWQQPGEFGGLESDFEGLFAKPRLRPVLSGRVDRPPGPLTDSGRRGARCAFVLRRRRHFVASITR
jgi:hypothetical protein